MFVRVRDFGAAHQDLFPESSTAGKALAQVTSAVTAIEKHLKDHVIAATEARKVDAGTRAAVYASMQTIAKSAGRAMRPPNGRSPFRLPRHRTLQNDLATARAFIEAATPRQEELVRYGLVPGFIGELETLVNELQHAVDARLNGKTARREAITGLRNALAEAWQAVLDLDLIIQVATRNDPALFGAWQKASQVEGQRVRRVKRPASAASDVASATNDVMKKAS
jgi:hypothetical protein